MDNGKSSFDISYIEEMSAGDKATKKQLLKLLLGELQNNLPKAASLLAENDWDGMSQFCHHFKSTSSFTGNSVLIKANLQLWGIAKNQGKSSVNPKRVLTSMQQQAKRIEKIVKTLLTKM